LWLNAIGCSISLGFAQAGVTDTHSSRTVATTRNGRARGLNRERIITVGSMRGSNASQENPGFWESRCWCKPNLSHGETPSPCFPVHLHSRAVFRMRRMWSLKIRPIFINLDSVDASKTPERIPLNGHNVKTGENFGKPFPSLILQTHARTRCFRGRTTAPTSS